MSRTLAALILCVACSPGANGKSSSPPGERDGGAPVSERPPVERTLSFEEARELLWPPNRDVTFAPASAREREALAAVIGGLWRGGVTAELARRAREARMVIERWIVEGVRVWVVREPDDARRGAGVYVVREGAAPARAVLLQAPHAYFDENTGRIAARMFLAEPRFHALFGNSLHRYQHAPGDRVARAENPMDVAHADEHAFAAATVAALDAGAAAIVQVHGFRAEERVDAAIILSAGRREGSSAASTRAAAAIGEALGVTVARYPEDTRELGGVTGAHARLARARGVEFLHLEISGELRTRLRADDAAAVALGRAIVEALGGP